MRIAAIAAAALTVSTVVRAAGLDDDGLRNVLTSALQRFNLLGAATVTIDDAPERTPTRWTEVEVDAAPARTSTAESTVTLNASDVADVDDDAAPGLRLQRTGVGFGLRGLEGDGVVGADVELRASRTHAREAWRGDVRADVFATMRATDRQTVVAWCSYDTGRTWIPLTFLPGLADLVVDDDTWWALLGLPLDIRWHPTRWFTLAAGFIDDPFAEAACDVAPRWSLTFTVDWRDEAARTDRGLDVIEELRATAGPTWRPDPAIEVDLSAGVATDRRLLLHARSGGTGGERIRLPTAALVSLECSVGY